MVKLSQTKEIWAITSNKYNSESYRCLAWHPHPIEQKQNVGSKAIAWGKKSNLHAFV